MTIVLCFPTEAPYSETPPSYSYDLEHPEEHPPRHDPLSFTGSPLSSPRLRSKSRSSRDTQSSCSLESTLSVMSTSTIMTHEKYTVTMTLCSALVPCLLHCPSLPFLHSQSNTFSSPCFPFCNEICSHSKSRSFWKFSVSFFFLTPNHMLFYL